MNLDLVFNVSNAEFDLGDNDDQELSVRSYNFGAIFYDLLPSSNWSLDAYGLIGYNDYDRKRDVLVNGANAADSDGIQTFKSSTSGREILIGFDAEYSQPMNETLNLNFGLNGSFSKEKVKSYSTEYYTWDSRNLEQVTGGVTVGLEYTKDALTAFADLGAEYITLLNGETSNYTNNGVAQSYTDTDTDDTYGSITVGFEYASSENVFLRGAVEGYASKGDVTGYSASLGVNVKF